MAITERDRRALILGGAAVGVIAVYFAGIEPLWEKYDRLVSKHQANATTMVRVLVNERKADYYAEQVSELEEKVGELSPPRPYSEQITAVSEKVVTAAQQSGIKLQGSSPTGPLAWPDDPELQQASIIIDAEADWEKVFKFVAALYRLEGILSVEQMELTGKPKGGRLTLKLTVSVLVEAPEQSDHRWAS